jgi:hypothetical protein
MPLLLQQGFPEIASQRKASQQVPSVYLKYSSGVGSSDLPAFLLILLLADNPFFPCLQ